MDNAAELPLSTKKIAIIFVVLWLLEMIENMMIVLILSAPLPSWLT